MVIEMAPSRAPGSAARAWKPVALGVVLVCCLVALFMTVGPTHRVGTPTGAVDLYVTAREHGDRRAMARILDGNADLRATRLSEVDGRPVDVTGVSIVRSTISENFYQVTVTWTDGARPASTDRLLVLPRRGDPSASIDWSVSVAP